MTLKRVRVVRGPRINLATKQSRMRRSTTGVIRQVRTGGVSSGPTSCASTPRLRGSHANDNPVGPAPTINTDALSKRVSYPLGTSRVRTGLDLQRPRHLPITELFVQRCAAVS